MSQAVEDAIHAERERVFWRQFHEAAAEKAELDLWEGTLLDGLENEDIPQ
jgi:hypothetical protein